MSEYGDSPRAAASLQGDRQSRGSRFLEAFPLASGMVQSYYSVRSLTYLNLVSLFLSKYSSGNTIVLAPFLDTKTIFHAGGRGRGGEKSLKFLARLVSWNRALSNDLGSRAGSIQIV